MCGPAVALAALPALATAGGAAATAATTGLTLGTLATTVGAGLAATGSIASGIQQSQAQNDYAEAQAERAKYETMLGAIEDQRTRERMREELGRTLAQLAGRGVQLDSPSALAIGERAARETSFASQSVRSGAAARAGTLTAEARQSRGLASSALMRGTLSAAGGLLTKAPDLWPGLAETQVYAP
ncbi:hypothetical protein SAMN05444336_101258 [Albimonas donghaensis]|uniref:Uncharacterized protein n=1 Tax=Albimonas donghaensis TaxID=356660 RepID=A0A1H2R721_9RHOB|nr:hypothetical protein [Albimonas donghaensis]SDW15263.1 hypothetical protein SAMN05444336_101258 [Albimonas donghaensis]